MESPSSLKERSSFLPIFSSHAFTHALTLHSFATTLLYLLTYFYSFIIFMYFFFSSRRKHEGRKVEGGRWKEGRN